MPNGISLFGSKGEPWTVAEKGLVISTIALIVSAAALGVIFMYAHPLTQTQHMTYLYADAACGGVALIALVLSVITKCRQRRSSSSIAPSQPRIPLAIDDTQMQKIQEWTIQNFDALSNKQHIENVTYYAGKHIRVFEHTDFPGLIIKLPRSANAEAMLKSIETAQRVCETHNLNCCKVPVTKSVPLDELSEKDCNLFVMEKINGIISPFESQEASEKAFEQFNNDKNLERKWRQFFKEAAQFICLTGYWDVDWRNILLMEDGFAYVDFENVVPTMDNQKLGIARLLKMAPPQFFDDILKIAKTYKIDEKDIVVALHTTDLKTFKGNRDQDLKLRSKIRKWHTEQDIIPLKKIDETKWQEGSLERQIVDKFNKGIDYEVDNPYNEGSLIQQRRLYWQPFCGIAYEKRPAFMKALSNLQTANVLCDWKINEKDFTPNLVLFEIYF